MSATDLGSIDAVAASLIEAPEAEAEEESVTDEVEEDAEADEVEAQADDDESEAETDEDDQEEPEAQEEPAPQLYTVKVDGKAQQVTLDELTRGYSGQQYIQQNMETLAAAKKEMQSQFQELQQERQWLAEFRQKAETGEALVKPKPPSRELFVKDPIGYMEQKLAYEEQLAEYQAAEEKIGQMTQRQRAEQEKQHLAYLQEQMKLLQERVPEFADPKKAPAYREKMLQAGVNYYGFTPQELSSQPDARYIAVLNDAMKYREMQEAQGAVRQKAEGVRPVVKPGAKRTESGNVRKARDAAARMRKTGSVDDVANFLLT